MRRASRATFLRYGFSEDRVAGDRGARAALTSPLRSFETISCRSIAKGNCLVAELRSGNVAGAEG